MLAEKGCDLAQGYFIAKPLPADALATLIQQSQAHFVPALAGVGTDGDGI